MRYIFQRPTIWVNEMSLWLGGMVYLFSGMYVMQQRAHIRIFILYDLCPRWLQRAFDVISTLFICVFAFAVVYGALLLDEPITAAMLVGFALIVVGAALAGPAVDGGLLQPDPAQERGEGRLRRTRSLRLPGSRVGLVLGRPGVRLPEELVVGERGGRHLSGVRGRRRRGR